METNRLRPDDKVKVGIECDGRTVGEYTSDGSHNVAEAISRAYEEEDASYPAEDCVFTVTDLSKGTSERYRLNAHGHVKLIV